jgi:hypothetical protein
METGKRLHEQRIVSGGTKVEGKDEREGRGFANGEIGAIELIPFWILDFGFWILDCRPLLESAFF